MDTRHLAAPKLSARQVEARAMLICLRDCSREIESIAARARAARDGSAAERFRDVVRGLSTEAARLRVELRNWHIASPGWVEQVQGRVDRLRAAVELIAGVDVLVGRQAQPPAGSAIRAPVVNRAADQVERRVYDYLYPRTAATPAVG